MVSFLLGQGGRWGEPLARFDFVLNYYVNSTI
jgi:hypothetical protein